MTSRLLTVLLTVSGVDSFYHSLVSDGGVGVVVSSTIIIRADLMLPLRYRGAHSHMACIIRTISVRRGYSLNSLPGLGPSPEEIRCRECKTEVTYLTPMHSERSTSAQRYAQGYAPLFLPYQGSENNRGSAFDAFDDPRTYAPTCVHEKLHTKEKRCIP
jgi:hypothetical protein